MARIYVAWELGGGLGHIMRLRPVIRELIAAGHELTLSFRQLGRAGALFDFGKVQFLQAPIHDGRAVGYIEACTFPHVLHNTGFSDVVELSALVDSWLLQIDAVQPELVLLDHSPTALLATRIRSLPTVLFGNGFSIPDSVGTFPNWRPELKRGQHELDAEANRVLDNVNRVLTANHSPPLENLNRLFHADLSVLTDIRELDAVPNRQQADYRCRWGQLSGKEPQWPHGVGKRIFVYLKPSGCVPHLFKEIVRRNLPTIVFASGLDRKVSELFRAPCIRFEYEPLNMDLVTEECDLAVLNGTHGSTLQFMLAGVPQLQLPNFLEQATTAKRAMAMGAALIGNSQATSGLDTHLDMLLNDASFKFCAQSIRDHYLAFNAQSEIDRACAEVFKLIR